MLEHAKTLAFRFLTSLKFWTVILGLTATGLAKHGIVLPPDMASIIAAGFGILLAAQGAADHGKAAALINAKTPAAQSPAPTVVAVGEIKAE